MSQSIKKNILVGVTGSIAAYKTAALVSKLVQNNFDVQVVATASALQFVGNATFEGLTGRPVKSAVFAEGSMMDHIELARWAEAYVIAPCTANTLADLALGKASDLVTTLALAFQNRNRLYLAPAMNTQMWEHPAVQNNLDLVREYGYQIIAPKEGRLACGEVGTGKMSEPEDIFQFIFAEKQTHGRVLVTLGGTREKIDAVRAITNTSTGQTGIELCLELQNAGFEVHALAARTSQPKFRDYTHQNINSLPVDYFDSHEDLQNLLKNKLQSSAFDHVVHLAAVSDFTVDRLNVGGEIQQPSAQFKIGSTHSLTLNLKKTSKLIQQIRSWSKTPIQTLVGFKLTHGANAIEKDRAIREVLSHGGVDVVVHNDLTQFTDDRKSHPFGIYSTSGTEMSAIGTKELALALVKILSSKSSTMTQEVPMSNLPDATQNLESLTQPLFSLEADHASLS